MKIILFEIEPMGKPRMVRSDTWSGRVCVSNYWRYKDLLNKVAKKQQYKIGSTLNVPFYLSMPDSWSGKKKERMDSKPHENRPDLDNLIKAFLDCLLENDSTVHTIHASKKWATKGYIEITE